MDERMGHIDGSVSARYAHVTPGMRKRLMLGLTEQWETALDARLAMSPKSPVRILDGLLRARRERFSSTGRAVSRGIPACAGVRTDV